MQIKKKNPTPIINTTLSDSSSSPKTSSSAKSGLFTEAFNVKISNAGKEAHKKFTKLRDNMLHEKSAGKATIVLHELEQKDQEQKDKLQRVEDLQSQLTNSDNNKLTDDDKQSIKNEINKLKEETKTPDDKIDEINAKISSLEKNIDTLTLDDQMLVGNKISNYKTDIATIKAEQKKALEYRGKIEQQAHQEQANQLADNRKNQKIDDTTKQSSTDPLLLSNFLKLQTAKDYYTTTNNTPQLNSNEDTVLSSHEMNLEENTTKKQETKVSNQ